jgi:hypothetical protein
MEIDSVGSHPGSAIDSWWAMVARARMAASDPDDGSSVSTTLTGLLAALEPDDIADFAQPMWSVLASSYTTDLWGAAYLINGGCSDDGFDYFRGWLMSQGRDVYERIVGDPDGLAELPPVIRAVRSNLELESEDMLGTVWSAYRQKTGEDLPTGYFTILYPDLDPLWDFDDDEQIATRLPALYSLYATSLA